ncbi:MAG: hypothetical protein OXJ64_05140 [Boseongicola sp.]|nr:hypothetical protein [Boseongicola sp.]
MPAILVHTDGKQAIFVTDVSIVRASIKADTYAQSKLVYRALTFGYTDSFEGRGFGIDLISDPNLGIVALILRRPPAQMSVEDHGQLLLRVSGADQTLLFFRRGQFIARLADSNKPQDVGICFDSLSGPAPSMRVVLATGRDKCDRFVGVGELQSSLSGRLFRPSNLLLSSLILPATPSLLTPTQVAALIAKHDLSLPSGTIALPGNRLDQAVVMAALGTLESADVFAHLSVELVDWLLRKQQLEDPKFTPRAIAGRDARPLIRIDEGKHFVVSDPSTGLEWLPWPPPRGISEHYLCDDWNEASFYKVAVCATWLHEIRYLGRGDWRLPTLAEALSLIERRPSLPPWRRLEDNKKPLHRSPLFGSLADCIWTTDLAVKDRHISGIWAACYGNRAGPHLQHPLTTGFGALFVRTASGTETSP